jgi:DNA polymerase
MSDPATDLVFDAVTRMKASRADARASLDSLARLQATATASGTKGVPPMSPKVTPAPEAAPSTPTPRPSAPPAGTQGSKAEKLAALRGPVLACTRCPHLVASRTQVVFGVGNPAAELMFIGEAPGADEDLVGEPFVGRAGQLLTKIIEAMGFRRTDVYIANILKCRPNMPPGEPGNRKPKPEEMNVCKPYLLQQIEIIQPKVLIALGATAVEGMLGMEKAGITRLRGNWREFQGMPLMPTFHPSFLLRPSGEQLSNKRLVWEDMLAVLERLGREITPKQRGYFLTK